MEKFDRVLYRTLCWVCAILMMAMLTLIVSQVLARYALHNSLSWSEELGRYIFVWMSFLGMAAAVKNGSHVALDLLIKTLQGKAKRVLTVVNGLLISLLSCAVVAGGIKLVQVGMRQRSPALKLSMHLVYIVVPVSGALLLYFALRDTYKRFTNKDNEAQAAPDGMTANEEGASTL